MTTESNVVYVMPAKSKGIAVLLALVFGNIGVHKFYLERPMQGVFYMVFFWTLIPWVIAILEAISYLFTSKEDFAEKYSGSTAPASNKGSEKKSGISYEMKVLLVLVAIFGIIVFYADGGNDIGNTVSSAHQSTPAEVYTKSGVYYQ